MKIHSILFTLHLLLTLASSAAAQKAVPVFSLKSGSTSFYRIHLKIDRAIATKSSLSLPPVPAQDDIDVQGILQAEVLPSDVSAPGGAIRMRTWFYSLISDLGRLPRGGKPDPSGGDPVPAENKFIDCVLTPAGEIDRISGLDALSPEQQQVWREWATRFAAAFLVESQNRQRGEKWSAGEPETSPSPLAELYWQKKSQYVRDESCAPLTVTRTAEFQRASNSDSCAVVVATATLLQKSSPQDSTPADYKQRGLRTRGTASGSDDVILSISRKTGQLVRATQNARQKMDVLISLADGGNRVYYEINATATSSVELVTDLPLILQPNPPK